MGLLTLDLGGRSSVSRVGWTFCEAPSSSGWVSVPGATRLKAAVQLSLYQKKMARTAAPPSKFKLQPHLPW